MNKKLLYIIALSIAIAALFAVQTKRAEPADTRPVVKIGAILPITGGAAKLGQFGNDGALLAIGDINKNPANKFQYRLVSENTEGDIKRVPAIYNKLASIDKVRGIVSIDSGAGLILKPLTSRDKVLHFSSAADVSVADGEYNFNNTTDLKEAVVRLVDMFERRGYTRVAFAGTDYPAAAAVIPPIEKELERRGIKTVARELVAAGQTQITPEVRKILAAKPDVVFMYAVEPQISLFARGLKTAGFDGLISGLYTLAYSEYPELLDGAVWLDYSSGSDAFKAAYRARFNADPNPASVALYDSVNMIVRVIETGDDVEKVVNEYVGINGKMQLRYGFLTHKDLVFFQMKNGKPEEVQE